MNNVVNKTIEYRIQAEIDGRDKYIANTTDVSLPDIEPMTDTIKGAGIMGEIDWPSLCQIGSMTFGFGARSISRDAAKLNAPEAQRMTVRWVTETVNTSKMQSEMLSHKAIVVGIPKKTSRGKVEKGNAMDTSYEFEVIYYREFVDGRETIYVDKFNNIYRVDGVNYAEAIENAL